MTSLSKELLLRDARSLGYKPEILEKVYQLLDSLQQLISVPYLKERLALKGGTALNLFYFEELPRLSVDIDLNYIGAVNRVKMLEERQYIREAIYQIFQAKQFELYRNPNHHAGGKMIWRYPSVLGQKGNLEIDLNYMYRQPIWPIEYHNSLIKKTNSCSVPLLDIHEIAAGKLSALFSRQASRDLFDAHYLLIKKHLDIEKFRTTWVIYIAMTDINLTVLSANYIHCNLLDAHNHLLPVLQQRGLPRNKATLKLWLDQLLIELTESLSTLLPLRDNEINFINQIRQQGKLKPELITTNETVVEVLLQHPAIQWQIQKAKK